MPSVIGKLDPQFAYAGPFDLDVSCTMIHRIAKQADQKSSNTAPGNGR